MSIFDEKRGVIFDLDGTLLDTMGIWDKVDKQLIETFGGIVNNNNIPIDRDRFLAENITGDIYKKYTAFLKEKYNLSAGIDEIYNVRASISTKNISNVDFKAGAVDFVKALKAKDYTLAIASLSSRMVIETYNTQNQSIISNCYFPDFFSVVVLCDDVKKAKPDPEIYEKTLVSLGMTPDSCIVIEDSLSGVISAKAAGIYTICIHDENSNKDRQELIQLSDYYALTYSSLIEELMQA